MEINVSEYSYLEHEDLLKVSNLHGKILELIHSTDIHEDLIDFMLYPFERILTHNGINLQETDY